MSQIAEIPPTWRGKVIYLYLRGGGGAALDTGIAMRDVRFENVNGRTFLAGFALSDPSDWVADLPLLVLWEEVIHVAVIDSPDEYFARSQRARALLGRIPSS